MVLLGDAARPRGPGKTRAVTDLSWNLSPITGFCQIHGDGEALPLKTADIVTLLPFGSRPRDIRARLVKYESSDAWDWKWSSVSLA